MAPPCADVQCECMSPWVTAVLSLASALIVAVVTSLLTVRLALGRFYSEKWWERKAAAYAAIIESMHYVREHADSHLAHEERGRIPMPPEGKEKLMLELQNAMASLRKHRDVGGFLISDRATAALNELFLELDKSANIGLQRTFFEYLDYRVGALDRSLEQMRRIAHDDLSLMRRGIRDDWRALLRYFRR